VTTVEVRRSSVVAAPPADVWEVITTFAGVNAELGPWLRMREPRSIRGRTLNSYEPGERAACWILCGGIVPIDRHNLGLESITDGAGFVEQSTTWVQRSWRHERSLEPAGAGTRVSDHLTFQPRVGVMAPILRRVIELTFAHRHRRLAARFGAA
jgi:ligand-binding SRPBCC domain-containing protein